MASEGHVLTGIKCRANRRRAADSIRLKKKKVMFNELIIEEMAQVVYLDPIDHVSGKLSKKSRVTYMYKADTDRKYTQIRGKRSTPYTAAELARFDKFASVSRSTANVMKNPTLLQTAMTEFQAQTTYRKLRSYVWHREWENYQV